MSRFLARALAAVRAEAAKPAALPAAPSSFGGYGGFGEHAGNENQPWQPAPWPEGADFHLTRDAARIAGLISSGCNWRWCPDGGLDVVKHDGLTWCLSPAYSRRLQAELLLPAQVLEAGR